MREKWKNLLISIILSAIIIGLIVVFVCLPMLNAETERFVSAENPFSGSGMSNIGGGLERLLGNPYQDDPAYQLLLFQSIAISIIGFVILTIIFYFLIGYLQKRKK